MFGLAKMLGGPWIMVAIVLAAAATGGWIVGGLKDRTIAQLKLQHAESVTKQLTDIFDNKAKFDAQRAKADASVAASLKELAKQRETATQNLDEILVQESSKDETLKACLDLQLPADVLRQFAP